MNDLIDHLVKQLQMNTNFCVAKEYWQDVERWTHPSYLDERCDWPPCFGWLTSAFAYAQLCWKALVAWTLSNAWMRQLDFPSLQIGRACGLSTSATPTPYWKCSAGQIELYTLLLALNTIEQINPIIKLRHVSNHSYAWATFDRHRASNW